MILYVDASAIVAIVGNEAASRVVEATLDSDGVMAVVTDLAIAESSAALARNGRIWRWSAGETDRFYRDLDIWASDAAEAVAIVSADVGQAIEFVRQGVLNLRAPDAIHIATAHRLGATLLTLDKGMARAAAALGVPYINPAEADAPGAPKD
ncbi:hypothetical protein MMB232_01553 [Brevundimonas subvibrioides]|uniref:type II toxin-antitoxin system VapC family toxin n=1 Tax=Brevundimonas subvibrioides TaxID=74313 RepID=UPI0032D591EF